MCRIASAQKLRFWTGTNYRRHFHQGMACGQTRHVENLEGPVKEVVKALPFAAESIDKIRSFVPSSDIVLGFDYIRQVEAAMELGDKKTVLNLQLAQLMAIAEHEQAVVLQPLIYDEPEFAKWTKREREWWLARILAPTYQISFSHLCEVDEPALKSLAPKDLEVENFESRMKWIDKAARKFHGLMRTKKSYMVQELNIIAGWVNTPDAPLVY